MKKAVLILLACTVLLCGAAQAEETAAYTVTLRENQTTGYVWVCTYTDGTIVAVDDSGYAESESADSVVGAGGTHTWTITGLQAGEASVTFTYTRSWESDPDDPVIRFVFTIDEAQNLTLTSTEGMPEQYMANKAVVRLRENQTTGSMWRVSAEPEGLLTADSDEYTPDESAEGMVGTGGIHTWIYNGAAEGTAELTFEYAPAYADGEAPAATVKLTYIVDEQLHVTLLGIDGDYAQYEVQE